jgi:hypothetical protein
LTSAQQAPLRLPKGCSIAISVVLLLSLALATDVGWWQYRHDQRNRHVEESGAKKAIVTAQLLADRLRDGLARRPGRITSLMPRGINLLGSARTGSTARVTYTSTVLREGGGTVDRCFADHIDLAATPRRVVHRMIGCGGLLPDNAAPTLATVIPR